MKQLLQQKSVRARAGSTRVYCTPVILPRSIKWTQVVSSWQNTMDHIGSAQQGGIPWHRTKQLNGKLMINSIPLRLRLEVGFQLEELHWIMNAKADWKWKWITMPMLLFGCICNGNQG